MTALAVAPPRVAAALHSCLYVGTVRHRRFDAIGHAFTTSLYFCYLDLDEIDAVFTGRWWWSARRPAPMRFRRRDYFGDPQRPLADCVRDAVAARTGLRPNGAVRVLTNLRCFGFVFNPVTIYYCFDRDERLVAALAEITNTPWSERHAHVVAAAPGERGPLRASFGKEFHVSPFQPMEQQYAWTLGVPGERLSVHMENHAGAALVFDATLAVERRPWTSANLLRTWLRHPLMAVKVLATIYWQAFRLWCKKAPFHTHPKKRAR